MTKKWQVNEDKAWFKKWWPEALPKNIEFEEMTAVELFERKRKKFSNEKMLWFLDSWMTYEETGQLIDKAATKLHELGLKKGDVCALFMPNCFQYVVSFFACLKLGAIPTGINPTYKPLEVLHHIQTCNVKAMICIGALFGMLVKPIIDQTNIEFIITTGIADLVSGKLSFNDFLAKKLRRIRKPKIDFEPSYNFYELLTSEPNLPDVKINPVEDHATYLMTGGTTGVPKACVLTHSNLVAGALQGLTKFGGEEPGTAMIGIFPMFHVAGLIVCMLCPIAVGGYTIHFASPPAVEDLLKTAEKIPATKLLFVMAELYFKRVAEFPDLDKYPDALNKFVLNINGAGPLHAPVRDAYQAATGGRLIDGYGLTETTGIASGGTFWTEYPVGTLGIPVPGNDWAIFDSNDFEKGPIADGLPGSKYGEENGGELCICGPTVLKEYLNNPEETADTLKEWDGRIWLRTGDIGFMTDDGCVTLRDRKKQLIKVAGHSVFPTEVETMLMKNDAVSDAAVAGLPDPQGKRGEITKAWVVIKPEHAGKITEESLIAWMKENITHWKVPAQIEFIEEVPKNIVGKVQRRALQEADPLYDKTKKI